MLVKNNIIVLAQDSLGCFYNFHELSSVRTAWSPCDLRSLVFPTTSGLTDYGFWKIVPYFTYHPPGFDWHKTQIEPTADDDPHELLFSFARKCSYEIGLGMMRDRRNIPSYPKLYGRRDDYYMRRGDRQPWCPRGPRNGSRLRYVD